MWLDSAPAPGVSAWRTASDALQKIPPVFAVAGAVLVGDGLGNLGVSVPLWIAIALAVAAAAGFVASRRALALAAAYFAIAIAASVSASRIVDPPPASLTIRNFADGSHVTVEGRMLREAERESYGTRLYVSVHRAAAPNSAMRAATGIVRIAVLGGGSYRIGDEIRLTAPIRFPRNYGNPGEFDYAGFMARERIDATMTARESSPATRLVVIGHHAQFPASAIESIRAHIGAFFDRNLTYPENAEMRALVIGDRGGIGDPLRDTFARAGMAHLLVISGLHLSIVAAAVFAAVRLAMMLLPGLASRGYANKAAAMCAAVAVCGYASIAGHHVSTVRALVMVLAYMFALVIDRSRSAVASLALAAIVICVALPTSTADIGFQLSFVSVIAIVLGMRRFAAWIARRKRLGRLPGEPTARTWKFAEFTLGYVAVSFWAMLGTAPLTAFHFNQFAMVGVFANAVVVPIMGLVGTVSGLLAAAASFLSEPAARLILLVGVAALRLSNWLAGWFVEWPMAWARIFTPTVLELAIVYALLMLWMLAPLAAPVSRAAPRTNVPKRRRIGTLTACVIVLGFALAADAGWWIRDRYYNPNLRVTFLSVGQGDGAVIRFPGSRVMLIDAGGAYPGFDAGERIVAPYLWSQKIMHVDYLAMSHPDQDHFGGLAYIAESFSPRGFWKTPDASADSSYAHLMEVLKNERIPVSDIGMTPPVGDIGGVKLASLNSGWGVDSKQNDNSMVLRLSFGGASVLFTGDLEAAGERSVLAGGHLIASTVLKVPHHGSATSSTEGFLRAVRPKVAVISDGYLNRFHFPAGSVIDRLQRAGATVRRADQAGAIMLQATPSALEISTFETGRVGSMRLEKPPEAP